MKAAEFYDGKAKGEGFESFNLWLEYSTIELQEEQIIEWTEEYANLDESRMADANLAVSEVKVVRRLDEFIPNIVGDSQHG